MHIRDPKMCTGHNEQGRGISLLAPALYGLDSRRARAHLKARLTARLTDVPECPLGVPEYPSDGLSYNPSDNGTPERGEPASAYGLGASVA
jgi:hypothetical protein